MAISEAKKRADAKWHKANYTQVALPLPKADAERLEAFCKARGFSKAGFIKMAIMEKMEQMEQNGGIEPAEQKSGTG